MAGEMTDLYVWVVDDTDGREGTISAMIPFLGSWASLTSRNIKVAQGPFREIAIAHGKRAERPVRLIRMSERTVIDEIIP